MERQGMIGRRTIVAGLAAILATGPARALPHGWDDSSPFAKWVESLLRPDHPAWGSCCGKGDLYSIVIEEDALGETGDAMGKAHVLDGSARVFPDGTTRPAVPNGAPFRFPKSKVNPPKDGNPGPTAWAFLSVSSNDGEFESTGRVSMVWCVIPLPPGV